MAVRRGFTLIEILAAIALATVAITPIIRLMDLGTKGVYKGGDRTYAVMAASEMLEVMRGIEFAAIPPRPPDQLYSVSEIRDLTNAHPKRNLTLSQQFDGKFTIGIAVSEIRPENDPRPAEPSSVRLVSVQVMWKNVMDQEESISLSSLITDIRAE